MGISLLTPLFLLGLAALAIPVIIHLTHSSRREPERFPSLMFVQRIPFRSQRRHRIRHWLLLALRAGAVLLLVAAFSRPFLPSSERSALALARAREVVVLLDRSYSMSHGDRWERAVAVARRAIGGVGADDRATLIIFSEQVESTSQRTVDASGLLALLADTKPGYRGTRYAPALEAAGEIVGKSDRPRRQVILITDLQRLAWDPAEAPVLPASTELEIIDVTDGTRDNVAVVGVSFERPRRSEGGSGEQLTVAARVANFGPDPQQDVSVSLELDGAVVADESVDIEPGEVSLVRFTALSLPGRVARGAIRLGADRLAVDDAYSFVLEPDPPLRVLIVESQGGSSLYLRQALSIAENPAFDVTVRAKSALGGLDLSSYEAVVVNDAAISRPQLAALARFVEGGGGLLLVLGRRAGSGLGDQGLLPARIGPLVDRGAGGGGSLTFLDRKHPIFEVFGTPRSGDFTAARFFRWVRLESVDSAAVVARFDDGTPALVASGVGAGRGLIWASDFENYWNDLVLQPVFLPFAHQLAMYLAGYEAPQPWLPAGSVVDLTALVGASGRDGESEEWVLEHPDGRRSVVVSDRTSRQIELTTPGFYSLRDPEAAIGQPAALWAVNVDASESDLTALDPAEISSAVLSNTEAAQASVDVNELLTPAEREHRQSIWWYLLLAAVILLLAETAFSNLRPRRHGVAARA